jgi:hypothetical protein
MFLSLIQKNDKPGGYIALLDLEDWWLKTFSKSERAHIVEVFQPLGVSKDILTTGNLLHTDDDRPLMLLSSLAGWFDNSRDRNLAHRIIAKAEEYIPITKNILDIHFFYQTKMKIFYSEWDNQASLQEAIDACLKQIELSDKAKEVFVKKYHLLPRHEGYDQLCIIYEKQKKYNEVIELAKQAKRQDWKGEWDDRIDRCNKKLLAQNRTL